MNDVCIQETPWGSWRIIEESKSYKIKIITVQPQQRLSYQKHRYRSEIWTCISGEGVVTINEMEYLFTPQKSPITINISDWHRIKNISHDHVLSFIEIQQGISFCESDIIRIKDDYGRI